MAGLEPIPQGGIYIALFALHERRCLDIGRLGEHCLPAGWYFYVGTAQRNLAARLARHARADKTRRWHIDYLAAVAPMVGALTLDWPREGECELARWLGAVYDAPVAGFGASDCRCPSHLFHRGFD